MNHNHPLIQHPPLIALTLQTLASSAQASSPKTYGSFSCHWCMPQRPGSLVEVTISLLQQRILATAIVASCRLDDDGYQLELHVIHPDHAFQMRMIEQLYHICNYQRWVLRHEGRVLDSEQAALEWIERYAQHFH